VHALLWLRLVQRDTWSEAGDALGVTAAGAKRRFQRTAARLRREVSNALALRPASEREEVLRWLNREECQDAGRSAGSQRAGGGARAR
jgi:hypothetical protein